MRSKAKKRKFPVPRLFFLKKIIIRPPIHFIYKSFAMG